MLRIPVWSQITGKNFRYLTRLKYELCVFEYIKAPMGLIASGHEFCARLKGVIKLIDDVLTYAYALE